MKATRKDLAGIKKLYNELFQAEEILKNGLRQRIIFELDIYNLNEKQLAKKMSYCVYCGSNLDENNKCKGCFYEFGY